MCGRFTLHHSPEEVAARFDTEPLPLEPQFNIAPSQAIAVITQNGARHLEQYKWGLVPSWAKDPAIGNRMINARVETVAEKPAYRAALARRRCLIPADGFYEWREADNPEEGGRTPMHIRRADGELFAFAGLWEEWHAPDGSPLRSCVIITGTPNPLVAPIHDRMPIILRREDEARWLDKSTAQASDLLALLAPYPAEDMEAYAVSRQVNAPGWDSSANIEPVGPARRL